VYNETVGASIARPSSRDRLRKNKTKEELQMNREKRITKSNKNAVTLAALHTHTHL